MVKGKINMMTLKTFKLVSLSSILLLTACSTLNSDFSCQAEDGVGCASISDVNDMVDTGYITTEGVLAMSTPLEEDATLPHEVVQRPDDSVFDNGVHPERLAEISMPIWIAPYTDDQDNFHSGEMVYTVVKEAQWEY